VLEVPFYITCFFIISIASCVVFDLNINIDRKHFKLKIETPESDNE